MVSILLGKLMCYYANINITALCVLPLDHQEKEKQNMKSDKIKLAKVHTYTVET